VHGGGSSHGGPGGGRKVIVVSARVHPGETGASYLMEGIIAFITGPTTEAVELRRRYIFCFIPMLNPDGVIVGNSRQIHCIILLIYR